MPACRRILCLLLLHNPWGACATLPEEKTCLLQVPPGSNENRIQAHLAKSTSEISRSLPQGQPQIIALDCGVLHGPANTLLAAQRALGDGAMALNVDAVLSGGRLVTAHNATHRLRSRGFPTFACGNLSTCAHLESELSPSCQYFKHYYLEAGAPPSSLLSMKFCSPQRFSFVEEFLEQFPKIPIIFDLKAETVSSQREAMQILHEMLETSFTDRPSKLTTVRLFLPPKDLLEMLDTPHWDWPRFNLGVGVPKSSSQTDAWEVLPHLSDDILDHVSAIFLAPQQLEENQDAQWKGRKLQELPLVCDIGLHEAESDFGGFTERMEFCVRHGASAIQTARLAAAADFLSHETHETEIQKIQKSKEIRKIQSNSLEHKHSLQSFPYLASRDSSTEIISQNGETEAVHFWSSRGTLQNGSGWTRCAGKLATSMLVVRLVELQLLPPFPEWQRHPVMKTLTLRQIMAGVGGLADYRYIDTWLIDDVLPVAEIAERALSFVNRSFVPGESFTYSNEQWAVVELAVERATALDFPTAAEKFLFQPLGLSENTYYRSADKPACWKTESNSIFERNLRAGIGLCSTADDMFLLGVTLRRSCSSCLFSEASMKEVLLDQLNVHFPSAVRSFVEGDPAESLALGGIEFVGRGFGGFHLKGGWFLAHGGATDFRGQNVLVQLTQGRCDKSSRVLVTFVTGTGKENKVLMSKVINDAFLRFTSGHQPTVLSNETAAAELVTAQLTADPDAMVEAMQWPNTTG
eukprot:Skav223725  [mRNA]  locus=scaffold205:46133:48599:+ [translate_table: standard]